MIEVKPYRVLLRGPRPLAVGQDGYIPMTQRFLIEGFVLGLATGHICLATCGPVYAPFLMMRNHGWKDGFYALVKISAGRFLMYVMFGIIAGALGHRIQTVNRELFTAIAYTAFSFLLCLSAFRSNRYEKGCLIPAWSRFADSPFLLGIATGINFCPSFLIALSRAIDLSGPVSGGLLFVAFFFGTSIFLIPLIGFGSIGAKKHIRLAGQLSAVLVAAYFTTQAVLVLGKLHYADTHGARSGIPVVSLLDSTDAVILSNDTTSMTALKAALSKNRPGAVRFASDTSQIGSTAYVFVDGMWSKIAGRKFESLKKQGRFIVVLPVPDHEIDDAFSGHIISFLKQYSFKKGKTSSAVFYMGHFQESAGKTN
jgi:sulfite exporter TauE/SafE